MSEWNKYRRIGLSEMRPYVSGEDLAGVSVSDVDDPPNDMGMIARNPKNHADQWYVARKYFDDNLELVLDDAAMDAIADAEELRYRTEVIRSPEAEAYWRERITEELAAMQRVCDAASAFVESTPGPEAGRAYGELCSATNTLWEIRE